MLHPDRVSRHRSAGDFHLWLAVVVLLAAAAFASCQKAGEQAAGGSGGAAAPSATAPPSEAQRTQEMEKKAKDIERQAKDIQNMQGTEQEKIDAVNKLEQQRQDLNRQGEGAPTESTPPPPQPPQ